MHKRISSNIFRALAGLLAAWTLQAGAAPFLSVQVPAARVEQGQQFVVSIQANDAVDLYAYQFDLTFDPGLLSIVGVAEGSLLAQGGSTVFYPGLVDNTGGTVSFVLGTLVDALPGVGGSGELALITFLAGTAAGVSPFTLQQIILLDSALLDIAYDPPVSGLVAVTAVPEPGTLALMLPVLPLVAWTARRRRQAA